MEKIPNIECKSQNLLQIVQQKTNSILEGQDKTRLQPHSNIRSKLTVIATKFLNIGFDTKAMFYLWFQLDCIRIIKYMIP